MTIDMLSAEKAKFTDCKQKEFNKVIIIMVKIQNNNVKHAHLTKIRIHSDMHTISSRFPCVLDKLELSIYNSLFSSHTQQVKSIYKKCWRIKQQVPTLAIIQLAFVLSDRLLKVKVSFQYVSINVSDITDMTCDQSTFVIPLDISKENLVFYVLD
jgi:hypothetical protein